MNAHQISKFITSYVKELEENNAAVFAGAGLSVGSGFVNWKELLRPIAQEINLDVDKESDLVTLAQFHVNESSGNRAKINKAIIEEFDRETALSENHRLLARLPIPVYWTTNYDKLIETALQEAGRRPDVKYTVEQLASTRPGRDAIVYKMHGDVDHSSDAVIIRDDYETYHRDKGPFLTALGGDLVSKTFLFIGLSFSDPNLDYILSRVRITYGVNSRTHYAILRTVQEENFDGPAEYQYAARRQELFSKDLRRFGIEAIFVDTYSQITEILRRIFRVFRSRSVFISGAAYEFDYGTWNQQSAHQFVQDLAAELINQDYRIVSGFGLGIGSSVISGALSQIYRGDQRTVGDQMILRPFPQTAPDGMSKREINTRYRNEMIGISGSTIFVFGNKKSGNGSVISSGVIEEFDLSVINDVNVIPIGATGYASQVLWKRVMEDFSTYYPNNLDLEEPFSKLGLQATSRAQLIELIVHILKRLGR